MTRGARGYLDAIAIDQAIVEEARRERRDVSVAWIDFRKAFDFVPHRWVRRMLRIIRAPKVVRGVLDRLMPLWQMSVELSGEKGKLQWTLFKINVPDNAHQRTL